MHKKSSTVKSAKHHAHSPSLSLSHTHTRTHARTHTHTHTHTEVELRKADFELIIKPKGVYNSFLARVLSRIESLIILHVYGMEGKWGEYSEVRGWAHTGVNFPKVRDSADESVETSSLYVFV